jgi:hypothetical protein
VVAGGDDMARFSKIGKFAGIARLSVLEILTIDGLAGGGHTEKNSSYSTESQAS